MKFLGQDVRVSLRLLRKSPAFTLAAIVTLALGIGANAVVFGVLNALILRPLNVPDPDSFYGIERLSDFTARQSYPDYLDMRDRNQSFDGLAAYTLSQAGLDVGNEPARVWVVEASGNYFDVIGIKPYLGRFFHDTDEHGPNSAPYLVLSYAYWKNHFKDDRSVVGRTVQLNKHPFTIIGVAPPEFHGTLLVFAPDVFLPMVNQEQVEGTSALNARGVPWVYMTMGHLKPGVTPAQAAADINSIWAYLLKTYPQDHAPMNFGMGRPALYGDAMGRPIKAFVTALMLLAGLILLAACANLGSLFAARASDRSREVALRLALGSSRKRILRQLFTEAMLISLMGGAVGLAGSIVILRMLKLWQPFPQFPLNIPVQPDVYVYGVALLLTIASGFLFGAVPVRQVLRTNSYEIVKSGASAASRRRFAMRDLLVVAQIGICAVLVTSSMVAVRGLVRSMHTNFGFEPQNAMLVDTNLSMAGYTGENVPAMQRRMIDAMETIPGVTSAGLINWPPLTGEAKDALVFREETSDLRPSNAVATAGIYNISPGYFQAAGTALLAGRALTWHDDVNSPQVAVVNREFGNRIFGSANNAVGRYFRTRDGIRVQVVGIVEDGKYAFLTEDQQPVMFRPLLQSGTSESWLVVRSNSQPQIMGAAIRSKLRELDAGLPSFTETWSQGMDLMMFPSRLAAVSLGVLGIMGAMLSITGIFGIAAYTVSKRRRELGIRIALGAQRRQVTQAALGRAIRVLAFGSGAGLLLGILASQVLSAIVYHASARDPLVLAGVVLAMSFLGLIGTWIPARRALSIDPLMLLRED
ncbi:MAG TPA: ABC transporter permease [Candidatus Angelobacter sp.]|jgi:predicted permease|nr:ABC transporter permease [Candidatus Angelobacter sp.]